jgi:AraC-like DNA-binding protein
MTSPPPRWFRPSAASPATRSLLDCRWSASTEGRHLLVPDGSMDIVWIEGRGMWLCGPDTASWTFELPARTACVGIRFRPGAAASVLRVDAPDVVDRRVPLDALIGSRAARIVDEQIHAADDPAARMAQLEHLVDRLGAAPDRVVDAAVSALAAADRRIDHLAAQTDLSPRQLQRRFVRHVGYPPSQFARIARLQRFLHRSSTEPHTALAQLAVRSGYADQSHLARDCRALTGLTPRQMRATVSMTSHAAPFGRGVRSVLDDDAAVGRDSAA